MNEFLRSLNSALVSTELTSWYQTLGTRVYLNVAPENATLPLCVYRVVDHIIEPVFATNKVSRERITIEFDQFHQTSGGVTAGLSASESLAVLLDNRELNPTGYDRIVLRSESRGVPEVEDDAIRTTSRFRAIGTRTST
jgi:hypothetical protein